MRSPLIALSKINFRYEFSSGRRLDFIKTPYSHSAGSFVTFDSQSGILFSSDLFGNYGLEWELYLHLRPECLECENLLNCRLNLSYCPVKGIFHFHKKIMTSNTALRYSLDQIGKIPFDMIAPQHGSIIKDKKTIKFVFDRLAALEGIGIDGIIDTVNSINSSGSRSRF
jgi:flavorubredoxin